MPRTEAARMLALLILAPTSAALAQGSQTDCKTCPVPPCDWIIVVQGEPTPFIVAFVIVAVVAFSFGYFYGKSRGRISRG
jgi:hypothetical protein